MIDKIIYSEFNNKLFAFSYEKDKLYSIEYCDCEKVIGNIYVGIVTDILDNIHASFVNFDKNQKGYYLYNENDVIYLNNKNTSKLCCGDRILVQVTSDKIKTKEYSLTSNITLTGKYVVLTVGNKLISISKKIRDNELRNRLKEEFLNNINSDYGFILRTACNDANIEDIIYEANSLIKKYEQLLNKSMHLPVCTKVFESDSDILSVALEGVNKGCSEIITDNEYVYNQLMENDNIKSFVRMYKDDYPLKKLYSLENELNKSLSKKVWLKSGAYIVIEHTEALNVIDVNTGKAIKKGNKEEFLLNVNIEAAKEIAKEIRKRNLSGIILIDFINMSKEESKNILISEMKKYISGDNIPIFVAGISNLGLVEITRKRVKKPLHELI